MLVGQQIGPFQIEKELGSGAMGSVYRGVYTKTGQRVAVKIMAPGLVNNETARLRFEREAAILKQFDHPNIVRLFGIGKFQGLRYYAMEYIEGESLDHVLSRRGRISWEEVCVLGKQLCSALQHSHEHGIIHRDLKPSNLMILKDGSLKLTDFGIAKDLDVTQLTEANCTVGTASYMSPEQCRGEKQLTPKSDLYSLGIVFYELLTGKKPFICENVMDMFMAHVQGKCERPARIVLEIPKWLDNLVVQMMEKKPEQRPKDAAMVAEALEQVLMKVEAQESAGVEAAKKKKGDRKDGDKKIDETDRVAARTLLGKKAKKKKGAPFYTRWWFVAAGLIAMVSVLGTLLYYIFRPTPLETLYRAAEVKMQSDDPEKWAEARNGPIKEYLERRNIPENDQTRKIREWRDKVDKRDVEVLLAKMINTSSLVKPDGKHQELAVDAARAESIGDLPRAEKLWKEIATNHKDEGGARAWYLVAEDRLRDLAWVPKQIERMKIHNDHIRNLGYEDPPRDALENQAFTSLRYELFGDIFEAQQQWDRLKNDTEKAPEKRQWFLLAASKLREVKLRLPMDVKDYKKDQIEHVRKLLDEAEALPADQWAFARKTLLDIKALYGKSSERDLLALVSRADDILKKRS